MRKIPNPENYIQLNGPLFEAVQGSGIFEDSKFFVDALPKKPREEIFKEWIDQKPSGAEEIRQFVNEHFLLPAEPGDGSSVQFPKQSISMEEHIRHLWPGLFRTSHRGISEFDSLIPLPEPYLVPGGRFREIYYWDSFFTSLGLMVHGYPERVLSMTKNFDALIRKFGHVPNGNRIYYLSRSQPPFFSEMVSLVQDTFGVGQAGIFLDALVKEHDFWMDKTGSPDRRVVLLEGGYTLNRYWDDYPQPRQESWREDVETAAGLQPDKKKRIYRDIRAACESGWDFSSRWFSDQQNLKSIETTRVLPVDLNCLLFLLEKKIADLSCETGSLKQYERYQAWSNLRKEAILKQFWNPEQQFFFDYQFKNKTHTGVWSLAGIFPLYAGIASQSQAEAAVHHLREKFLKPGGVVTSLTHTGQQWDSPNGWAPLQWIAVKGLQKYGFKDLAEEVAVRWLALNEKIFNRTSKMVEKYDVCDPEREGGGGEYPVQDGFGWTNGVAAAFREEFGPVSL